MVFPGSLVPEIHLVRPGVGLGAQLGTQCSPGNPHAPWSLRTTELHRSQFCSPRSHSKEVAELRLEPIFPAPAFPSQVCLGQFLPPCGHPSPCPGSGSSLLALVQHKGPRVIISRHGNDCLTLEGPWAGLVHCVAGDGGCCVACPVESIPATVISQAFHRAHVCEETGASIGQDKATEQS